jgi:hypothetical protein
MRETKDGGWVFDDSAHLLSRALVSQSSSVTYARSASNNVVFRVNCCIYCILREYRVYMKQIVCIWCHTYDWCVKTRKAIVSGSSFYTGGPESWCSATSSVKQAPEYQHMMVPERDTSIENVHRMISEANVTVSLSLSVPHPTSCRSQHAMDKWLILMSTLYKCVELPSFDSYGLHTHTYPVQHFRKGGSEYWLGGGGKAAVQYNSQSLKKLKMVDNFDHSS